MMTRRTTVKSNKPPAHHVINKQIKKQQKQANGLKRTFYGRNLLQQPSFLHQSQKIKKNSEIGTLPLSFT